METKPTAKGGRLAAALLAAFMAALPLSHYLCLRNSLHIGYICGTIYAFAGAAAVLLAAQLLHRGMRPGKYELLFGLLVVFGLVSSVACGALRTALLGSPFRGEGLLMLVSYWVLFYSARLVSPLRGTRFLVRAFLIIQLLHCIYGLDQQLHFLPGPLASFDYYFYAVSGVAGNPNAMASLTVMAAALALGETLYGKDLRWRVAFGLMLPVFVAAMGMTKTFSAFVGLGVVVLWVLAYAAKDGGWRRLAVFGVVLAAAAAVAVMLVLRLTGEVLVWEIREQLAQLAQLAAGSGVDADSFAAGRPLLWRNCLELFWEKPLTGIGIDNLMYPYLERFGLFLGQYADKCHNEFLQVLVTMGLPAFFCWMALYILLFRDLLRRTTAAGGEERALLRGLILCLSGYLAQAFFNISVIDVAPYFWIFCGLAAPRLFEAARQSPAPITD